LKKSDKDLLQERNYEVEGINGLKVVDSCASIAVARDISL